MTTPTPRNPNVKTARRNEKPAGLHWLFASLSIAGSLFLWQLFARQPISSGTANVEPTTAPPPDQPPAQAIPQAAIVTLAPLPTLVPTLSPALAAAAAAAAPAAAPAAQAVNPTPKAFTPPQSLALNRPARQPRSSGGGGGGRTGSSR
jgi:hypothetical protein